MQLTFHGAARQVTGSCYLFETGHARFLVDCGMFQGPRAVEARNAEPFAFAPGTVDFVLLSHAHIDHSGLLPRLWLQGFHGNVFTTQATIDLLGILLPDSAYLQQVESERSRQRGNGHDPLYTVADAEALLRQCRAVRYGEPFRPAPGVQACLRDAGHILGSASVELTLAEAGRSVKVVVSGDLGQPGRPIVRDPVPYTHADVLLVESTYGDRDHKSLDETLEELVAAVNHTLHDKGGNVLVPAFAVGRTQELLYWFSVLSRQGRFSDLRIFLDSPMATAVTTLTARHLELFDEEARNLASLPPQRDGGLRLKFLATVEDSMSLNRVSGGAIIIAASGMCEGGRIRHHLRHHLPNPRTTVLITGFQARGTLGRRIVDGARAVRIYGEEVAVNAEVITLGGFSAHADQSALLGWMGHFRRPPGRTFLVHGEPEAQDVFAARIAERLGWQVETPEPGTSVPL